VAGKERRDMCAYVTRVNAHAWARVQREWREDRVLTKSRRDEASTSALKPPD